MICDENSWPDITKPQESVDIKEKNNQYEQKWLTNFYVVAINRNWPKAYIKSDDMLGKSIDISRVNDRSVYINNR